MKDGYYWVKRVIYPNGIQSTEWAIAKYKHGNMYIGQLDYELSEFIEIGDYIETPEKYKDN